MGKSQKHASNEAWIYRNELQIRTGQPQDSLPVLEAAYSQNLLAQLCRCASFVSHATYVYEAKWRALVYNFYAN